jgi:hypothetical protein
VKFTLKYILIVGVFGTAPRNSKSEKPTPLQVFSSQTHSALAAPPRICSKKKFEQAPNPLIWWSTSRGAPPTPRFVELKEITHQCHSLSEKNDSLFSFSLASLSSSRLAPATGFRRRWRNSGPDAEAAHALRHGRPPVLDGEAELSLHHGRSPAPSGEVAPLRHALAVRSSGCSYADEHGRRTRDRIS